MPDVLVEICAPMPCNAMPSQAALNADFTQLGHVNAASAHSLTMLFHGLQEQQLLILGQRLKSSLIRAMQARS